LVARVELISARVLIILISCSVQVLGERGRDGWREGGREGEGRRGNEEKEEKEEKRERGGGLGKDGENDVVGRAMPTAAGQPSVHKRRRKGWLGMG
jgi:hypothetical protein